MDMKIFIGHGGSPEWIKLKSFLNDKLGLACSDFDEVAPAGKTIAGRLREMLDSACFAFLVMTAEDEHADGTSHARENVIHETGLFQGRLGFEKAIVLLESGCKEFSNINGLIQIHFQKGDILGRSEAIRDVLLREGILDPAKNKGFAPQNNPKTSVGACGQTMEYRQDVYWLINENTIIDGPFCPICYEKDNKKIHMREDFIDGVEDMSKYGGYVWDCYVCGGTISRNPNLSLQRGIKAANEELARGA